MGAALGILAFVYIFLRRHKRFAAAKKFLIFLPLTLPCLAFLSWSLYSFWCHYFSRSARYAAESAIGTGKMVGGIDEVGRTGGHGHVDVDITVEPKDGETYEEYLKRFRWKYQGYCPNCDKPCSYCEKHQHWQENHRYCDRCGFGKCHIFIKTDSYDAADIL